MTSIRKSIKACKKNMYAKSITINLLDTNEKAIKLTPSQNRIKRQALAEICKTYGK